MVPEADAPSAEQPRPVPGGTPAVMMAGDTGGDVVKEEFGAVTACSAPMKAVVREAVADDTAAAVAGPPLQRLGTTAGLILWLLPPPQLGGFLCSPPSPYTITHAEATKSPNVC